MMHKMSTVSNLSLYGACISELEKEYVTKLKNWAENEADFYGKTEEVFLLWFLRGCKYDLDKSKKKMRKFYENRIKIPQWWANKDLNSEAMQAILKCQITTLLKEPPACQQKPTIAISQASRLPRCFLNFDDLLKTHTTLFEIGCHRQNIQINGAIWILDFHAFPYGLIPQIASPIFIKNLVQSVLLATPIKLKGLYAINAPLFVYSMWAIAKLLLPQKLKERLKITRCNDLKSLFDNDSHDLIPEEYGGTAASIKIHSELFYDEVATFADYILDDNKYGFQILRT